jgi:hypothetical protein
VKDPIRCPYCVLGKESGPWWRSCRYQLTVTNKKPRIAAGQGKTLISTYELFDSFRSWSACFFAFLASAVAFTVGLSV